MPPIPNHPYRVVVTNGGQRYCVISLVRVSRGAMPSRVRHPLVEEVLLQVRIPLPHGVRTGLCNPERPADVRSVYDRELLKVYDVYDRLASAPVDA